MVMVPVDDGFGIMVVSGCRKYVTEPVDVVLVVTGRVLYVVGRFAACMYGVVLVVGAGGASSMIVLMVVVEYTTRVVTLLWMCIIVCGVDVIIFNAIERYVSCVMVVRVGPRSCWFPCVLYTCVSDMCVGMCV